MSSKKLYVCFTEESNNEDVFWNFYIPVAGNTRDLRALEADVKNLEFYSLNMASPLYEWEVDTLVKFSRTIRVLPEHTKLAGKLNYIQKMGSNIHLDVVEKVCSHMRFLEFGELFEGSACLKCESDPIDSDQENNESEENVCEKGCKDHVFVLCFKKDGKKPVQSFVQWNHNEDQLIKMKKDLETVYSGNFIGLNLDEFYTRDSLAKNSNMQIVNGLLKYEETLEKTAKQRRDQYLTFRLYKGKIQNYMD